MEELVERIARWGIHPEELVTHRYTLDRASEAYELMAGGKCGKVAIVFDEEVRDNIDEVEPNNAKEVRDNFDEVEPNNDKEVRS
jgi:hypothetical protein